MNGLLNDDRPFDVEAIGLHGDAIAVAGDQPKGLNG